MPSLHGKPNCISPRHDTPWNRLRWHWVIRMPLLSGVPSGAGVVNRLRPGRQHSRHAEARPLKGNYLFDYLQELSFRRRPGASDFHGFAYLPAEVAGPRLAPGRQWLKWSQDLFLSVPFKSPCHLLHAHCRFAHSPRMAASASMST